MYKKLLTICLALAVCLALAGCGVKEEQAEEEQAAAPLLLAYRGGVINTAGQVILEPPQELRQDYLFDNQVLADFQGRPCYALQTENRFLAEPPAQYAPRADGPVMEYADGSVVYWEAGIDQRLAGRTFRFYDSDGELLQTVDFAAEVPDERYLRFYFAPDGDLTHSVFVLDELAAKGQYQLFDYAGKLLAVKRGVYGESLKATLAPGFVALQYSTNDQAEQPGDYVDFYSLDGQPLATAQKYFDFEQLDFSALPPDERQLFYKARYTNAESRRRYDLLDGDGNVLLGNLLALERGEAGVYAAAQGWGELLDGWLDLRGGSPVWLPAEPEPEYADYSAYRRAEDERLIAAMPTEQQYDYIYRLEVYEHPEYETFRYGYATPYFWHGAPSPYFEAGNYYYPDRRRPNYGIDVLDENGRVMLSGLEAVKYLGHDLFAVRQGFSRGVINIDGEWIYQESIFDELED